MNRMLLSLKGIMRVADEVIEILTDHVSPAICIVLAHIALSASGRTLPWYLAVVASLGLMLLGSLVFLGVVTKYLLRSWERVRYDIKGPSGSAYFSLFAAYSVGYGILVSGALLHSLNVYCSTLSTTLQNTPPLPSEMLETLTYYTVLLVVPSLVPVIFGAVAYIIAVMTRHTNSSTSESKLSDTEETRKP